jgi:hypothetical protein
VKKTDEMKRYLRIVEETGCPVCHSDDVHETNDSATEPAVLAFICNECGYSETCPEQPDNMIGLVGSLGGRIRDGDGNILPEFLKTAKTRPKGKKKDR